MVKIILLGYMGVGKTTIGRLLAAQTGIRFRDLDAEIEAAEGHSIPELFETIGEIRFRKLEHQTLKNQLSEPENTILALGGGTPCYAGNHELLDHPPEVVSFYLKASIPKLIRNLSPVRTQRPLLANIPESELPDFIGAHLFERSFYYQQATHTVNTDGLTPMEVVSSILDLLA